MSTAGTPAATAVAAKRFSFVGVTTGKLRDHARLPGLGGAPRPRRAS